MRHHRDRGLRADQRDLNPRTSSITTQCGSLPCVLSTAVQRAPATIVCVGRLLGESERCTILTTVRDGDAMKPWGVLLILLIGAPVAADEIYPSALVLDIGYAIGPPGWHPWANLPAQGDPLLILGSVSDVNEPFTDLLPVAGAFELTYAFRDFACAFSGWGEDLVCSAQYDAWFDGGRISVFLDVTPDADFANPATFLDGELVLEARSDQLHLWFLTHCMYGDEYGQRSDLQWIGGAWFDRVSRGGVGYAGENLGRFDGDVPNAIRNLGYVGRSASSVDAFKPLATTPTTWGRVKALYR